MARFRFSIASLLLAVLTFGLAFAALREPTDPWDSAMLGLSLLLLLISTLFAVHRPGERRAYWLGFALFGWSYFVLSQISTIESRLPTTKGLAYLDSKIADRAFNMTFTIATTPTPGGPGQPVQAAAFMTTGTTLVTNQATGVRFWNAATGAPMAGPNGTSENFVRIGHSLLALVLAMIGGHLSRTLRGSSPSATDQVESSGTGAG
jgi:hypothetical protein